MAAQYLVEHGFTILKRNWKHYKAEIDIIARKDDILHIVEVKARHNDVFENPEDAVNQKKRNLLLTAANAFAEDFEDNVEVQFDIFTLLLEGGKMTIDFMEDAFKSFE